MPRNGLADDMDGFFWTIGAIVVAGLLVQLPSLTRKTKEWLKLPTLDEYWAANPNCKTGNGTKCHVCGSRNFRNCGATTISDDDRTVSCRQCGTTLYRIVGPDLQRLLANHVKPK